MPSGTLVSGADLRTLGLDSLFQELYANSRLELDEDIKGLFANVEAKTNTVNFAALFDSPVPVQWIPGQALPFASIDSLTHSVTVIKFARGIPWDVDDEEDDQLQAIPQRVQDLATEFAMIPIRAAVDLVTGTASLLSSVPTSYDGSALHIASTRFGDSGGNTISGSGTGTPTAFQTDFYSLKARLKAFRRHTATGEPLWSGAGLDDHRNYLLVCSATAAVEQNLDSAFRATVSIDITGVAGVSNVLAGNQPRTKAWTRLSGSDWYGFYTGSASKKPFILAERHNSPIQIDFNEAAGSDWSKEYDRRGIGWKQRLAVGIFSPETTIKVDN